MIGVPEVTVECTTVAPPKIDCSATSVPPSADSPVASVRTPELVLIARRPATSLPCAVAATSTAAGDCSATSLASSSATGATT